MLSNLRQLSLLLLVAVAGSTAADKCLAVNELKVMSFNTWSVEETASGRAAIVDIVNKSGADIVGFQELGYETEIASALGWYCHSGPKNGTQIMSRYQVVEASDNGYGAKLELPGGVYAWFFNTHLLAYPYQPYDLRDGKLSQNESAVIAAANSARGAEIDQVLADIASSVDTNDGSLLFLTGDFNEPSCLDWTAAAAAATERTYDLKVEWPASRKVLNSGLADSLRTIRPDEVNDHSYSWTTRPSTNEVFDRIDFVYFAGNKITVKKVENIGADKSNPYTEIEYPGYPSDHRAVLASFEYAAAELDAGRNILTAMDIVQEQNVFVLEGTVNYTGSTVEVTGWQALKRDVQGQLSATQDITFADSSNPCSNITINAAGEYILRLSAVVDGTAVSDELELVVFDDSCKAAKAFGDWQVDYFDLNSDCVVDIKDLAVMSTKWLKSTTLPGYKYYSNSFYNSSTILAGASGLSTNSSIASDHGSNQPDTPHIALIWSPVGGSNNANNQWESYSNWPGGGEGGLVYQMGSTPVDSYKTFTIVFTPESGYNVKLECLDLNVWSGGGATDVSWEVTGTVTGVLGSGVFSTPDGQVKNHVMNVSGSKSEVLTLTMTQQSGDGTYLAMDNLMFSEIEPLN